MVRGIKESLVFGLLREELAWRILRHHRHRRILEDWHSVLHVLSWLSEVLLLVEMLLLGEVLVLLRIRLCILHVLLILHHLLPIAIVKSRFLMFRFFGLFRLFYDHGNFWLCYLFWNRRRLLGLFVRLECFSSGHFRI